MDQSTIKHIYKYFSACLLELMKSHQAAIDRKSKIQSHSHSGGGH